MSGSFYKIATNLMYQNKQQELLASNLAGSNLAGFKGRHLVSADFEKEMKSTTERIVGAEGVSPRDVETDFAQGNLKHTGRSLDFAISGDGFFQAIAEDKNELLTRNGNFMVDEEGFLTTQEGHKVDGLNGPIRFDDQVNIQEVYADDQGMLRIRGLVGEQELGQLRIVNVEETSDLSRASASYYLAGEDQDVETMKEGFKISQNYVEAANLSPVQEMATMIQSVREFEMGQRMMKMVSEMSKNERQMLIG